MDDKIYNIIIGTAGHIDHGKSTLVQKMTGVNPMRLREENERGMTIDMGFVPWQLKNGKRVGIIDVPGHERFVKNMVAGATGIDLVLFVIAADDAVMPQTREHLQIMSLLGLKQGVVVLTKIDNVDEEMLELVKDEIQELVKGTFLEGAPVYPVDSISGRGFDVFLEALNQLALQTKPRPSTGLFRMPIQRVFTRQGYGTVATGIPINGAVKVGDEVEILPQKRIARVRKIQAYKMEVDEACAGHSTALNLSDIDYTQINRGDMICTPGMFHSTTKVDAYFYYLKGMTTPLRHLTLVRFHIGTSEILAKIRILKEGERVLYPGETGYVQFHLETATQVSPTDRFIVRLHSPMITIGGGEVMGESHRFIRGKSWELEQMDIQFHSIYEEHKRVEFLVLQADKLPISLVDLQKEANLIPEKLQQVLQELEVEKKIVPLDQHRRFLHQTKFEDAVTTLEDTLKKIHKENKLKLYVDILVLKNRLMWEPHVFEGILEYLLQHKQIEMEKGQIKHSHHQVNLSKQEREWLEKIESIYLTREFGTPRANELAEEIQGDPKSFEKLIKLLIEQGVLVQLPEQIILHKVHVEKAKELAIEQIQQNQELVTADFGKNVLKTTRKYFIPLLDYFDQKKITIRKGSNRILSPDLAKTLSSSPKV
ncbi:MAG: selenocysteine-specific translation elongation factor, partial [Planctomycetota bacterium]